MPIQPSTHTLLNPALSLLSLSAHPLPIRTYLVAGANGPLADDGLDVEGVRRGLRGGGHRADELHLCGSMEEEENWLSGLDHASKSSVRVCRMEKEGWTGVGLSLAQSKLVASPFLRCYGEA